MSSQRSAEHEPRIDAPTSVGLRPVVEGEFAPTDLAVAPGQPDRKYVVDQPGLVHVLEDGSFRDQPFLDVRDRVVDLKYGHDERGLLGLAFHPEYQRNGRLFVHYSAPPGAETPDDWNHKEVLAEFEADEGLQTGLETTERRVLEMPHPGLHHNAGELAFGPDGYLYMGMGDGGHTGDVGPGHVEGGNGQDVTENLLGSILRIDVDEEREDRPYAVPEDNPLVDDEGRDELYAWGFRNPYRLSFDSDGRLFVGDVGEHLFEWVNLVEKAGNYGWNVTEGSHCFDPEAQWEPAADCPDDSDRGEPLLDPIVEYSHLESVTDVGAFFGSAIVGGYVYDGDAIPELQGSYVFGDLSKKYDTPRGRLFAAHPSDDDTARWEFHPLGIEGLDSNLVDDYLFAMGRDHDGEVYLLTSRYLNTRKEQHGTVYEVAPREDSEVSGPEYGWYDAASDAYWYSLYNMNNTFVMSGNGIVFPFDEAQFDSLPQEIMAVMKGLMQRAKFMMRSRKILENAPRKDDLPVENPHLNVAPFTEGDPTFVEEPDVPTRNRDRRPDADTMRWDRERSSQVVTPAALGWTHLKGITWAKSFEHEFDLAPIATRERPQILATAAQLGVEFALQNGHLLRNTDEDDMTLVGAYRPADDEVVEDDATPDDYAAMLWFLSDLLSYAQNGWFGYENPSPLIEVEEIERLADRMAFTTFTEYPPQAVLDATDARDLGVLLGATGWYGTQADVDHRDEAVEYATELADAVESRLGSDGRVEGGGTHQAATQGAVGQGFAWASQLDGVDRLEAADATMTYLLDDLWDDRAGTFASELDADTYTITVRDAGDITGGLLAADAVLEMDGVKDRFATHFEQTFNRGRLQRATRWQAYRPDGRYTLPVPQDAGGEFGQAAVYNGAVQYDTTTDEWRVTDDTFRTAGAMYCSNQELWISVWGGSEFPGRGVPGRSDRLERWEREVETVE
jgi:glucose/arabinose dehydrogenase